MDFTGLGTEFYISQGLRPIRIAGSEALHFMCGYAAVAREHSSRNEMSFWPMMTEYDISGTRRLYALVRLLHACAIICILHFY